MSQLALYFLGSPRIYLDGAAVEIKRRKVLSLLIYLAITAQRHSRDELAELLYGKKDREHARTNLRQTLSFLRSSIGKDQLGTDRLGVWLLCGKNLWIDTEEFKRLLKKGQKADTQGDLSATMSHLTKAVELYRGDFLSGFYLKDSTNFEDWQLLEQESFRRQQAYSLQRLVEIHGIWEQYGQAIDYGHRWLALNPLEEAVHRQLMRLKGLAGQHYEALQQYEKCRSVLERELGEQPEEETERLRELIASRNLLPKTEREQENPNLTNELYHPETLESCPSNLRIQATQFIGRKKELAAIGEILRLADTRLLTLTGAGGTGKTRLAMQVVAGFPSYYEQRLFFVDLAPLRNPGHVAGAIAAELNIREDGGNGRSLVDILKDYLRNKRVLLLLDNFEHLLPAASQIVELLAGCPHLKIVATSRQALHLLAEKVFPVPPMQLPSQGQCIEVIKNCDAVRLFVERASSVLPTFELTTENAETVAGICTRLDGLPLAIELAAAHIELLSPQTLLTKLQNRLNLLEDGPGDLPERQQSLRSEFDWSHELLEPGEQHLFMRLSVFPASFTLDAAESICSLSGEDEDISTNLSSLTKKSLIRLVKSNGESRFQMLETIREYARERLDESDELDILESHFTAYFLQFTEQIEPELYSPDQMQWFGRIDDEYSNIRTALSLLYDRQNMADGLRLAGALGWFWFRKARFSEGQHWLELFRDAVGETAPPGCRAKAAYFLGWMRLCISSVWGNPEGKHYFRESLSLWHETGDKQGIALSQVWLAWKDGDIEDHTGWAIADESVAIARETENPWTIAWCLKVAYSHLRRKDMDLDSRRSALEEAISLAREVNDPFLLSQTLNGMGNVFSWIGELEAAEPWYLDSLRIAREIGDSWSILENIYYLADGNFGLGWISKAKELFSEGLQLAMSYGARGYLGWFIGGFYGLAKHEGQNRRAVRLGAFSESILNPNSRYNPYFAEKLGVDEEIAAAEWKVGYNMTMEQAVDYALMDE
jgi:predicted ATPase/DNA-binding SARP family transcriptional activator